MKSEARPTTTRLRTRGGLTTQTAVELYSGAPSGNGQTASIVTTSIGTLDTMFDTVTPNYKKLSGEGKVIFNPMQKLVHTVSSTDGGYQIAQLAPATHVKAVYTGYGNWVGALCTYPAMSSQTNWGTITPGKVQLPLYSLYYEAEALQRAIAVAATKAQTIPHDASLLVALAEYRKTLALVPGILDGWRKLFARINAREASFSKKRTASRPQDAARNLRDLGDTLLTTWLAMRFGARPLIMDTIGVVKALQRSRDDSEKIRITQRGNSDVHADSTATIIVPTGITNTSLSTAHTFRGSVRAMTLWEARISAMDDLGVNLSHVPEALVDLTRFSFVLNWIININDAASAMGAAVQPGWSKLGGCYVTRREASSIYQAVGQVQTSQQATYKIKRELSGLTSVSTRAISRVPKLPSPSLVLRPMPFEWLKDARLLDAIALLRVQTRGKGVQMLAQFSR